MPQSSTTKGLQQVYRSFCNVRFDAGYLYAHATQRGREKNLGESKEACSSLLVWFSRRAEYQYTPTTGSTAKAASTKIAIVSTSIDVEVRRGDALRACDYDTVAWQRVTSRGLKSSLLYEGTTRATCLFHRIGIDHCYSR